MVYPAPSPDEDPAAPDGSAHGMTDLEERLRSPEGAAIRSALVSRLVQLRADFDGRVRRGLEPEAYRRARAIIESLDAARSLLEQHRPA